MLKEKEQTVRPEIFILILNWNNGEYTIECLESVFRNTRPDYQVVVIDNGSTDDSVTRIRKWAEGKKTAPARFAQGEMIEKPIPIISYDREKAENGGALEEEQKAAKSSSRVLVMIQTGANLGFAGGNNVGIKYACARHSDFILLLNNDAFFRSTEALPTMVDFMERTPRAGACGGRLFYPDGSPQQSYGNFPSVLRILSYLFPLYKLLPQSWFKCVKRSNVVPDDCDQGPIHIDWPSGACLMVRSKMIEDVGMLDEQYFLYMEETDWCFRMRAHGWDRYYLPQVEVTHAFGGTVNNSGVSMRRYHLESQFIYYQKYFSKWALSLILTGYMFSSYFSVLYFKVAARLLSAEHRVKTTESRDYWLFALNLAIKAMRNLVSGNRATLMQSSNSSSAKLARHA